MKKSVFPGTFPGQGILAFFNISIVLVGLHSVLLGLFIIFFSGSFSELFIQTKEEYFFFIRQSGIFIVLLGLFYLFPLINLKKYYPVVFLTIFNKVVAVLFLIGSVSYFEDWRNIVWAAGFDGSMALVLSVSLFICKRKGIF